MLCSCMQNIPVTNGDQKVFGGRGEEFKVSDVQLLHLDGLTELNDEPERHEHNTEWKNAPQVQIETICGKKAWQTTVTTMLHYIPDFITTGVQHV